MQAYLQVLVLYHAYSLKVGKFIIFSTMSKTNNILNQKLIDLPSSYHIKEEIKKKTKKEKCHQESEALW